MAFRTKRNSMLHQVLKDPAREAAINEEIAKGARWVLDGALRRVPPYYYTYLTFCKQRWIGQTLLDVFASEFRDRSVAYYRRAIEQELVLVNDKIAATDQVLRNGDLIMHRTHKHEQPVPSRPIRIVHEDDSLVVIDKPSGLPVHPTGRFNFNSVMAILEHEQNVICHPCNRLDRLTSGLMFLAKSSKSAEKLGQQIRDRAVRKQYLALVVGEFPLTASVEGAMLTVDPKLSLNMMDGKATVLRADTNGEQLDRDRNAETANTSPLEDSGASPGLQGSASLDSASGSATAREAAAPSAAGTECAANELASSLSEKSKHSLTTFKRISFDASSNRSLVLCMPHTGRTHQIRVHLQHLGFPIANDPIYTNPAAWGADLGRGLTAQSERVPHIREALDKAGKSEPARSFEHPDGAGEMLSGKVCEICETALYTDPGPNDLDLYLHALRYEAADRSWGYETQMPEWATTEHAQFMRLALDEARKAPDLPGAFAVGAVLVHAGKVLETGYTRELEGNTHAEQNALAKLEARGEALPPGSCLYTTMEPCTFRLSGNAPCSERVLARPEITSVFVGVLEPSTFVANNTSRAKLEAAGVVYLQVPGFAEEALRIAEKGHAGIKRKQDSVA